MSQAEVTTMTEQLEQHLGDPHDLASRMPYRGILENDEHERFPESYVDLLRRWGIQEFYIPESYGGRAVDVEVAFNLQRAVSRRDPTSCLAVMLNCLGFLPTWTVGTDDQKQLLVEALRQGRNLSFALSERHHGSDMLANEAVAEKVPGGYLLTGEKWPFGNANRADVVSVLARTAARGGPAGYSMFLLRKAAVARGSLVELAAERLHGTRSFDLGGVRMDRCFVADEALLGGEGHGLEIALRALQAARTIVNSFALGAFDTALRVTLDFSETREIFGHVVSDIPYSRRQLVECFVDLLTAEAVAIGAVRSLQAAPEQISVRSSVVKAMVPTLLERSMGQLTGVLGARFFLRDHPRYGIYQKMVRDLPVATLVDGNPVVNLKNIGSQLADLLARACDADSGTRHTAAAGVAVLYGLDAPLPRYRPWDQELVNRGMDDTLLAVPVSLMALRGLAERAKGEERGWLSRAVEITTELLTVTTRLRERCGDLRAELGRGYGDSAELHDLAARYCLLHAAAACLHVTVHSYHSLTDPFPSGALLLLQLERIYRQLQPAQSAIEPDMVDAGMRVLRHLYRENRAFSYWSIQLAPRSEIGMEEI